ncbi:MAG: cell wall-binding repeat-containing protein [Actinomycetia bacterium]|nr:cell wall-binding repeat-containing protein [Actinomycetes bacterium]
MRFPILAAAVVSAAVLFGSAGTAAPAAAQPEVASSGAATPATADPAHVARAAAPAANVITVENRNPGTTDWKIPWPGRQLADDRAQQIKGYFSETSVAPGSTINLHVRSTVSTRFTYSIYRLGWYGGTGGRLMYETGTRSVASQPNCVPQRVTGLTECNWSVADRITVPTSWVSGIYVAVLDAGGFQNYATFTVRDGRPDALLAIQPVNTHQAYNNFPNDGANGKSLYAYNSQGFTTVNTTTGAVKVSFDRPYADSGVGLVMRDEHPFVMYAESRGYDITYATEVDYHARPQIAAQQRAVVFVGHSEYWTSQMYDTAESALRAGRHLSFFGANNVYWRIRLEPSTRGVADRTVVSYKRLGLDPIGPEQQTVLFRQGGRPEQALLGQQFGSPPGLTLGEHPWVVRAANSWFYRGTGLRNGNSIRRIVGIETDYRHAGVPMPTMSEHYVLAQSPTQSRHGSPGVQEAALYRAPSGAWVFDAGTLNYTRGLATAGYVDARVQMWTTNLLSRQMNASSQVRTSRIGGPNRYATAAMISKETFAPGVSHVYLSTGLRFPDAVAASAATQGEVPILLTRPGALPPETRAELERLAPSEIKVLGNTDAVSDEVMRDAAAAAGARVTRIFGGDRYQTAAKISAEAFGRGVDTVYVATGLDFPDALAAGSVGAQVGAPVILTAPTVLSDPALREIRRLAPRRIVVVGSSAAVSDGIAQRLGSIAPVVRLGGSNRFETAQAIVRDQVSAHTVSDVVMATGMDFPDALTGGPMVAARGGALVLTRTTLVAQDAEEVVRNDPARITFLGSGAGWLTSAMAEDTKRLFDVADGRPTPTVVDPQPRVPTFAAARARTAEPLDEAHLNKEFDRSLARQLPWLAEPDD